MRLNHLFSFVVLFLVGHQLLAQYQTTIPLDPAVRYGKLKNGMTYFIRHNEEPKDRASFYFVQNVGAILEEDHQNGLAHFLEHMAFNGTKHFEGKGIINFLEKHGVQFGRNINAYTAQDETVYNLSGVPVTSPGLMDSCLLVLHDWSGYLLLTEEEIDAERGVIREEWRTRRNTRKRIMDQTTPLVYKDSKYAERDVIGSLDVINNFKYDALRDYYKTWYRPDQQAVVVVGDFDVNQMEEKVKTLFAKIPLNNNLAQRKYYEVPDHEEVLYVVGKDVEANSVSINWIFKQDMESVKNEESLKQDFIESMFCSMMNNRFKELLQKPEAASVGMSVGGYDMARTKKANYLYVAPKDKRELEAFNELMVEMERVNRYGFTSSELERTKVQFLRSYDSYYKNREKIGNDKWAKQLGDLFLKAKPVPSVEWELDFAKRVIPAITLQEVNDFAKVYESHRNSVFSLTGSDKEGVHYPTKEELLQVVNKVKKMDLEPYKDEAGDAPLVKAKLSEAKIIETFKVKGTEAKGYELENGARVILLPTDYSKDQVLCSAFSFGGSSKLETADLPSSDVVSTLAKVSGVGDFDAIQLRKKLTGKIVSLNPGLGECSENFSGSASPEDLETLLQLLYLRFEVPRFDKEAFETQIARWRNSLVNLKSDNGKAFKDSISLISANYHPRVMTFGEEFLDKIRYEKAVEIYKDRFADASDFTFLFVGNIDEGKALPLIQKYVGNISTSNRKDKWLDHKVRPKKGDVVREFSRPMSVEKTTVFYGLFGDVKYSLENRLYVNSIAELLSKRYLETIREEEGGSYGVGVRPSVSKFPAEHFQLSISFDCDPAKQARLREIVKDEIEKLTKEGPVAGDLEKIKENYLKNRKEIERKNSFWLNSIKSSLQTGSEFVNQKDYQKLVESITAEKVKEFAGKLFKKINTVEVVMGPEKK